jgi:hypothetical protein
MILFPAVLLAAAALAEDTRPVETLECKMAVVKVIQATGMELREISKTSPHLTETTVAFALKHPLVPDDDYAAELSCIRGNSLNLLITSVDEYPPSAWFNLVAKGGAALTGASVHTVRKAIDECYAKTLGSGKHRNRQTALHGRHRGRSESRQKRKDIAAWSASSWITLSESELVSISRADFVGEAL